MQANCGRKGRTNSNSACQELACQCDTRFANNMRCFIELGLNNNTGFKCPGKNPGCMKKNQTVIRNYSQMN